MLHSLHDPSLAFDSQCWTFQVAPMTTAAAGTISGKLKKYKKNPSCKTLKDAVDALHPHLLKLDVCI
jgi:hypothetical protein